MHDFLEKLKLNLIKVLSWVCCIIFIFMTILGFYQIITRYVFNAPSTISEELLTYSFTWLALLSAANVFGKRDHMRMGYFADKLKGRPSVILHIISELLVLLFSLLILLYGGTAITKLTLSQATASLGISMGTVYMVVPICGVIVTLFALINIYELVCSLKTC